MFYIKSVKILDLVTHLPKKTKSGVFLKIDNRRIVSYNAYLSLKYNCHINLEYVYDEKCCRYVFKYLMKKMI